VTAAQTVLYVANGNAGTVTAYNATTGTVAATIGAGRNPAGVTVTPDESAVYVANAGGNTSPRGVAIARS